MTSPSKKYIGIDPGKSGGITVVRRGYIKTRKCPDNVDDMSILFSLMANDRPCEAIVGIEKVWSFPTDSHSTAFTFGMNYGHWYYSISRSPANICYSSKMDVSL